MKCKDFDKEIKNNGIKCQLYHATRDVFSVCNNGLKPRCELIQKTGLGGGSEQLVSFTRDLNIAVGLAKDIQTMIYITRGDLTLENIRNYLDKYDNIPSLIKKPSDIWDEVTKHFFNGWYRNNPIMRLLFERKHTMYVEELQKHPIELICILFSFPGKYVVLRDENHGDINPAFWNRDWHKKNRISQDFIKNFSSLNPWNVGVVKVEGIIPGINEISDFNTLSEILSYLEKIKNPNYDLIKDPTDFSQLGYSLFYPNTPTELNAGFNVRIDKFQEVRLSKDLFHNLEIVKTITQTPFLP